MTTIEQSPESPRHLIDYTMSDVERSEIFRDSIKDLASELKPEHTNVLIVPSDHGLANYVRAIEREEFPASVKDMAPYEADSRFVLVLQDDEDYVEHDLPAHIFRLNTRDKNSSPTSSEYPTGLPTFDDALKLGLVSEQQLLDYYQAESLPILGEQYINVEANVSLDIPNPSIKRPYSPLGYRAIFELAQQEKARGVVAYQNPIAIKSMARIGLKATPLVNNPDLYSQNDDSPAEKDGSPARYHPLTLEAAPWSLQKDGVPEHNSRIFTDPEYAIGFSRVAALVASKNLNVINIV